MEEGLESTFGKGSQLVSVAKTSVSLRCVCVLWQAGVGGVWVADLTTTVCISFQSQDPYHICDCICMFSISCLNTQAWSYSFSLKWMFKNESSWHLCTYEKLTMCAELSFIQSVHNGWHQAIHFRPLGVDQQQCLVQEIKGLSWFSVWEPNNLAFCLLFFLCSSPPTIKLFL